MKSERAAIQPATIDAALLDQIATSLGRNGFRIPALIALRIGHPLTFIGGQLLWVAQPALSLLLPARTVGMLAQILEEPAAVQGLLRRLEADDS